MRLFKDLLCKQNCPNQEVKHTKCVQIFSITPRTIFFHLNCKQKNRLNFPFGFSHGFAASDDKIVDREPKAWLYTGLQVSCIMIISFSSNN